VAAVKSAKDLNDKIAKSIGGLSFTNPIVAGNFRFKSKVNLLNVGIIG
jgi:hypothetical protein